LAVAKRAAAEAAPQKKRVDGAAAKVAENDAAALEAETPEAEDDKVLAELRERKKRSMREAVARRREAFKRQEAERKLPMQLLFIILNSLGVAIVVSMIAALTLRNLPGDSIYVTTDMSRLVLFMSFLLGFFVTLLFLMRRLPENWWQLANEFATAEKYVAPGEKWGGALQSKPNAAYAPLFDMSAPKKKGDALPATLATGPDDDTPFTAATPPPEAPEGEAASEGKAAPEGESAALFAAKPKAETPEEELKKAKEQATAEIDKFAASVAQTLQSAARAVDAMTRFAMQLYLAGAVSAVARKFLTSAADSFALLMRAAMQAGSGKAFAESFALNVEDYAQREAYRDLIKAGQSAMEAQLKGESPSPEAILTDIDTWTGAETKPPMPKVTTFLFTDIVDAKALTQRLGNMHAQRVVKAHDEAVREAIAKNKGRQVKHTGDGVIATFLDPAKAVAAAQSIQQKLDAHNQRSPHLSANVRIAINAGEAVEENGAFFGATFKLTAKVCDMAKAGQILAADVVRSFCKSSPHLFQPFGEITIEELGKARTVVEVSWMKSGAGLDYSEIGARPTA
jgi:adenylate cyclase